MVWRWLNCPSLNRFYILVYVSQKRPNWLIGVCFTGLYRPQFALSYKYERHTVDNTETVVYEIYPSCYKAKLINPNAALPHTNLMCEHTRSQIYD